MLPFPVRYQVSVQETEANEIGTRNDRWVYAATAISSACQIVATTFSSFDAQQSDSNNTSSDISLDGLGGRNTTSCGSLENLRNEINTTSLNSMISLTAGGLALAIPLITEHYYRKNRERALLPLLKKAAAIDAIQAIQNDQAKERSRPS
jgi:hypothetical protein